MVILKKNYFYNDISYKNKIGLKNSYLNYISYLIINKNLKKIEIKNNPYNHIKKNSIKNKFDRILNIFFYDDNNKLIGLEKIKYNQFHYISLFFEFDFNENEIKENNIIYFDNRKFHGLYNNILGKYLKDFK